MAHRIADEVDEDLHHAAGFGAGEKDFRRRIDRDQHATLGGGRGEQGNCFASDCGKVDPAKRVGRGFAHRADHREQVAPGRGDVAGVGRIIAAQGAVVALDDLVGAIDDPVER